MGRLRAGGGVGGDVGAGAIEVESAGGGGVVGLNGSRRSQRHVNGLCYGWKLGIGIDASRVFRSGCGLLGDEQCDSRSLRAMEAAQVGMVAVMVSGPGDGSEPANGRACHAVDLEPDVYGHE